jgi:TetR/AcrR family transcriptional regulator, transcriptional repressor for nem operon
VKPGLVSEKASAESSQKTGSQAMAYDVYLTKRSIIAYGLAVARPKAFDRTQVLLAAMQVFWVKGYEATSLEDLLAAMKIGRQSLYDTFGDKRALFIEALGQYRDLTDAYLRGCLADAPTVKAAFERLFMQVVDEPEADQRRGCLLINSAVELAPHDPATAQIVVAYQRATERLFRRGLELAQKRGELAADRDVRALARYLVSPMQGLRVMAKADPNKAALRDVVGIALGVLG